MIELSSISYEVEVIYPIEIDLFSLFNETIEYLQKSEYAAQKYKSIIRNIKMHIEENEKVILALSKYVSNLSKEGQQAISDTKTMVVEGSRGSDLGTMLYARSEVQKETNKLIAKKVQLDQNFRVLNHGNELPYYGEGIMSKKNLVYTFLLVLAYLLLKIGRAHV